MGPNHVKIVWFSDSSVDQSQSVRRGHKSQVYQWGSLPSSVLHHNLTDSTGGR